MWGRAETADGAPDLEGLEMTTWVFVASALRAHCFEYDAAGRRLVEVADFTCPKGGQRDGGEDGPAADAPRPDLVHALSTFINAAVFKRQCDGLVVTAPDNFLKDLLPRLSQPAQRLVTQVEDRDCVQLPLAELKALLLHLLRSL